MKIEIIVFIACIVVFVVNTVLDHLFNWWAREVGDENRNEGALLLVLYGIKTALIIIGLKLITT